MPISDTNDWNFEKIFENIIYYQLKQTSIQASIGENVANKGQSNHKLFFRFGTKTRKINFSKATKQMCMSYIFKQGTKLVISLKF